MSFTLGNTTHLSGLLQQLLLFVTLLLRLDPVDPGWGCCFCIGGNEQGGFGAAGARESMRGQTRRQGVNCSMHAHTVDNTAERKIGDRLNKTNTHRSKILSCRLASRVTRTPSRSGRYTSERKWLRVCVQSPALESVCVWFVLARTGEMAAGGQKRVKRCQHSFQMQHSGRAQTRKGRAQHGIRVIRRTTRKHFPPTSAAQQVN